MKAEIYKSLKTKWEDLILKAEKKIIILTPYFDHLLLEILSKNRKKDVKKVLITDFNPDYFLQNIEQLICLKKLLKKNIEVKHYKNLHAKVLLIDDGRFITIGSQNFTKKGENTNYELSSFLLISNKFEKQDILNELINIESKATNISLELVNNIIKSMKNLNLKYKEIIEKANEVIINNKNKIRRKEAEFKFNNSNLFSFKASYRYDYEQNFYYLSYQQENAQIKEYINFWIYKDGLYKRNYIMFPIINLKTLDIKFIRLGSTSSSLLGNGVSWDSQNLLEGYNTKIKIHLDSKKFVNAPKDCNIIIDLEIDNNVSNFYFFYDLIDFQLLDKKFCHDEEIKKIIINKFFDEFEHPIKEAIEQLFSSFKFNYPLKSTSHTLGNFVAKNYETEIIIDCIQLNNIKFFVINEK